MHRRSFERTQVLHSVQDTHSQSHLKASRPEVVSRRRNKSIYKQQHTVHFLSFAQDELVLVEHTTNGGGIAQIIYRNGGLVDAQAVEVLCEKVCSLLLQISSDLWNCHT